MYIGNNTYPLLFKDHDHEIYLVEKSGLKKWVEYCDEVGQITEILRPDSSYGDFGGRDNLWQMWNKLQSDPDPDLALRFFRDWTYNLECSEENLRLVVFVYFN